MTDHDLHALSGAYAVDALDADERARYEAHLATCADCREEVASLQEAAALLGTDPVEPPSSVRDSVLAGIASIRPLPPLTPVTPAASDTTATAPAAGDELAARRTRRSLVQRLARTPLLVAAAVVLLLAVGTALVRPWADDRPDQPNLSAIDRVLTAADATSVEKEFEDGSRATVIVSRSEGRAVIRTEDMALAPAGKVYELWLQTPEGAMVPAGLMPDEADNEILLDGDASEAKAVGITIEPDGGSRLPTTTPIAVLALEA